MQKTVIFAALGLLAFSPAAFADDDNASCTTEPQAQWMSTDAISAKAVAAGYKDIRQVKTEGTCYEVYAMTTTGERAEVVMNPVNGDVVKAEIDN
ncbi:PepSY domain-containing protein [Rhizobium sp. 32-5/1]|uniref:PepSY domain-containing protein n=1 Tax=Rhizobium sp. 32-5/1 TaxID=3019602 RepID=UPI00240E0D74|nr:PepSY domain-containing protein [Rhizobium sp. 32-5/1]WEZ84335.1 PepSY domain-containing protein [Rhizobium sp. 32-5/1]